MENKRYIDNTYEDHVDGVSIDEKTLLANTEKHLTSLLTKLYEKCPPTSQLCEESTGHQTIDITMYTGTCGNIYIQWRLYEMYKKREDKPNREKRLDSALAAFKINEALYKKYNKPEERKRRTPAFFMGEPGLYTLGAILNREKEDMKETERCFKKVIGDLEMCSFSTSEDELLYGNAGYLYCLLLLFKTDPIKFECRKPIVEVVNLLKKSGEKIIDGKGILSYRFPRKKGNEYLGGAHGTFGIVYILLKAVEIVEELKKDKELMMLLESTCDQLLTLQTKAGNFPTTLNSKKGDLVHFCHGAPGLIPTLLEAHKTFDKKVYLKSALTAGEVVWKRGILFKGNSLCHGIAGNAYFLHSLYRYTEDLMWKHRFFCFLDATWNESIQQQASTYDDPGRKVTGMPDSPYSLMEGMGGTVVFYADVISGKMLFPGYEL